MCPIPIEDVCRFGALCEDVLGLILEVGRGRKCCEGSVDQWQVLEECMGKRGVVQEGQVGGAAKMVYGRGMMC